MYLVAHGTDRPVAGAEQYVYGLAQDAATAIRNPASQAALDGPLRWQVAVEDLSGHTEELLRRLAQVKIIWPPAARP